MRQVIGWTLAGGMVLLGSHLAEARVLHVPKEFPSIQGAVNAAASGDTVLVSGGTYREVVTLKGGVRLYAVQGQASVIDASGLLAPGSQDYVVGWPATSDRIEVIGFTLVDDNYWKGIGVLVQGSNHLVEQNTIEGQYQFGIRLVGATRTTINGNRILGIATAVGIQLDNSSHNNLLNNFAKGDGRGLNIWGGSYNRVRGNVCHSLGARPVPAGIGVQVSSNNRLENNTAYAYGGYPGAAGLSVESSNGLTVRNCILQGLVFGIRAYSSSSITVSYSDVIGDYRHVDGDGIWVSDSVIFVDPLFVNVDPFRPPRDFRLQANSPARNRGVGQDRDGSRADLGAYGGIY